MSGRIKSQQGSTSKKKNKKIKKSPQVIHEMFSNQCMQCMYLTPNMIFWKIKKLIRKIRKPINILSEKN